MKKLLLLLLSLMLFGCASTGSQVSSNQNKEEKVKIEVIVEADGRISSTKVVSSSGNEKLDNAGLNAAKSSIYQPKIVDGKPRSTRFIVVFTFELE